MNNNFIYVLDETLANNYKLDKSFLFMHETIIDNQKAWVFSTDNQKLNFNKEDRKKVLYTNRLMF